MIAHLVLPAATKARFLFFGLTLDLTMEMSMTEAFTAKLATVKKEHRLYVGSHHMEVIKESCIQLAPLVTCKYQLRVLKQVQVLTSFARCYLEHEGEDRPQLHVEMLNVDSSNGGVDLCSRISQSFSQNILNFTVGRKQALLEDLNASVSIIDSGLKDDARGAFSSHGNFAWLFSQCLAILENHRDMLKGILAVPARLEPDMTLTEDMFSK